MATKKVTKKETKPVDKLQELTDKLEQIESVSCKFSTELQTIYVDKYMLEQPDCFTKSKQSYDELVKVQKHIFLAGQVYAQKSAIADGFFCKYLVWYMHWFCVFKEFNIKEFDDLLKVAEDTPVDKNNPTGPEPEITYCIARKSLYPNGTLIFSKPSFKTSLRTTFKLGYAFGYYSAITWVSKTLSEFNKAFKEILSTGVTRDFPQKYPRLDSTNFIYKDELMRKFSGDYTYVSKTIVRRKNKGLLSVKEAKELEKAEINAQDALNKKNKRG